MPLDFGIAALVLLAAALHASWNAFVKVSGDKLVLMAVVMGFSGLPMVFVMPFVPVPEPASWPYLAVSLVVHWFYYGFLASAYRFGDLSQVYPVARGSAPLLVAAGAWALAGEALGTGGLIGIAIVSLGIMSLAWRRGSIADGSAKPVSFALMTGLCIAVYSVADGMGVRRTAEPFSYISWLFVLDMPPVLLATAWLRRGRVAEAFAPSLLPGFVGGLCAAGAYAIVIWAMSRGAIAHVVALRETSVILAALIGTLSLGEPFGRRRVAAACTVAAGAALLQLTG
jgi:drug/metabolite transporter (DMT)-like permease